jgi:phosphocarrier protein HPr
MIKKQIEIINKLGLHARAAAKFVTCANNFASDVHISRGKQEVNGKSIMGVMMLAAAQGTTITVKTNGEDEMEALAALEELINNRFDEQE